MDSKEVEVKEGEKIKDAVESMGVLIACADGTCGVCKIQIVEGMENLDRINDCEKEMGCEGNERLGCQCRIKKGKIVVKPVY